MESMLEKIINAYPDDEFLKADGFDDVIIGVDEKTMRLIYSVSKCVEILIKDMPNEDHQEAESEATEYFYFNVAGSYVGEKTPIFCEDGF